MRFVASPGGGSACPRNPHRRGDRIPPDPTLRGCGWQGLSSRTQGAGGAKELKKKTPCPRWWHRQSAGEHGSPMRPASAEANSSGPGPAVSSRSGGLGARQRLTPKGRR
ncbi:hypothetical protein HVPorG_04921 [Roseomonas mucosa]|nr:hypothetical protein HVPorG_04921 [Roseomonas mucosa]